jgi:hypothetical protein
VVVSGPTGTLGASSECTPVPAHGTSDMPVWGPLFRELNPYDSRVDVRLSRLVDYLKSIQLK